MNTQLYTGIKKNSSFLFLMLLFFIFIGFFNSSCDNINNKNEEKDKALARKNAITSINEHYDSLIQKFDKKFVSHFPSSLDTNIKAISSSTAPGTNIYLMYTAIKCDSINSVYDNYKDIAIKEYSANDSCLLVANRFENDSNFWKLSEKDIDTKNISKKCYKDKLPVPNFYRLDLYKTSTNECRLSDDFSILVIDADKGKYKDSSVLPDTWYMPKKWRHGYSRGVAISKKRQVLVYWVIIW